MNVADPVGQFREAIHAANLIPPDIIEADGELHRFASNGKRGDLAGWYVLHLDGIPAGAFGCWRSGLTESWHADVGRTLTDTEREQQRQRIEAARAKREHAERESREQARERAVRDWAAATPAPDSHPYLARKAVKAHGLRVDRDGHLVVPVRDRMGAWQSLQRISPDGEDKKFLRGGKIAGGYYAIGKPGGTVGVAEGFATAATIHEATGHAVAVAFNAGNLEAVARALRQKFPKAKLIVCADDDAAKAGNPGLTKASAAAQAVGGLLAVPDFGADRPEKTSDFNDLAAHRGVDAVRGCIDSAKPPNAPAWPEPRPLPPELHPVPAFDMALLPDSLRPWIEDVCERVQCPPDFVAVPAMVALGSLIGRKVRIRPKARDSWTVVPNVWGCIVGRPGTTKSPAVAEALRPLERMEAQAREEYGALQAGYEAQAEMSKLRKDAARDKARAALKKAGEEVSADALRVDEPEAPTLRRYRAHQSSVQALGIMLHQNPNGLLVERDELASLLSSLAQEEQAEARGFYLTGADGTAGYAFDTIARGHNRVPAVCLSIIGTTQPGKIGRYLRHAQAGGEGDDGMMQRFGLMVWPDTGREWRNVDRFPDSEARRQAFAAFDRLDRLTADAVGADQDEDCRYLRFAPGALEAFTEWRTAWETRLRSGELHPALESHFAKYRKTVPALALILHLAEQGASGPVALPATLRALAWAEYLEAHAIRCYGATVAGELSAARRILGRIKDGELADGFKARDIDRARWSGLTDREMVRAALELLVGHGYLAEAELPATAAGGRPTLAYRIHPSLRA